MFCSRFSPRIGAEKNGATGKQGAEQALDVRLTALQDYRMRRSVFLVGLVVVLPLSARAQRAGVKEPTPHISAAFGVHYGSPMRMSLAGGVLVDMSARRNDGVVAVAEAGQQGAEVSLGYFRMLGRYGSGYSLRAAGIRTLGNPWNASRNTTYAGVEASWMVAFGAGARVGYLRRTSRRVDDAHDHLASIGILIGI